MTYESEDRAHEHYQDDEDLRYSQSMQDIAVEGQGSRAPKAESKSNETPQFLDLGHGPQLAEQTRPGGDLPPTSAQPGTPELKDHPAQTEFEAIGVQAGGTSTPAPETQPETQPETKPVTPTDSETSDLTNSGNTKGDSNIQFCAADGPLGGPNQASDAAGAVNLASGGRYGNNPFFSPSSGALGLVTGFDVSPLTIAGYVEAAWGQLGALNNALSGTRPADFHPINGTDGRPAVINMPQHFWQSNPSVTLGINGRNENITMSLPGFNGNAVTLVTNGTRVLAIDPKNNDTWQLQQDTLFGRPTGFSWTKLPKR